MREFFPASTELTFSRHNENDAENTSNRRLKGIAHVTIEPKNTTWTLEIAQLRFDQSIPANFVFIHRHALTQWQSKPARPIARGFFGCEDTPRLKDLPPAILN